MTATATRSTPAKPAAPANLSLVMLDKRAFNEFEAANYLGMSASYLRISRMDGDRANRTPGPSFIKVGKAVRYLKEDLDAWLEAHRVTRGKVNGGK
jgi:predicted DNA-binding transcriptional regulator AlpA